MQSFMNSKEKCLYVGVKMVLYANESYFILAESPRRVIELKYAIQMSFER